MCAVDAGVKGLESNSVGAKWGFNFGPGSGWAIWTGAVKSVNWGAWEIKGAGSGRLLRASSQADFAVALKERLGGFELMGSKRSPPGIHHHQRRPHPSINRTSTQQATSHPSHRIISCLPQFILNIPRQNGEDGSHGKHLSKFRMEEIRSPWRTL